MLISRRAALRALGGLGAGRGCSRRARRPTPTCGSPWPPAAATASTTRWARRSPRRGATRWACAHHPSSRPPTVRSTTCSCSPTARPTWRSTRSTRPPTASPAPRPATRPPRARSPASTTTWCTSWCPRASPLTSVTQLRGRPGGAREPRLRRAVHGAAGAAARSASPRTRTSRPATSGSTPPWSRCARAAIDAFFWSGGLPTRGVADLAASVPIRLLTVQDDLARIHAGLPRVRPRHRAGRAPTGSPSRSRRCCCATSCSCAPRCRTTSPTRWSRRCSAARSRSPSPAPTR